MKVLEQETGDLEARGREQVPVGFVPTPTREYRTHRKSMKTTIEPGLPTGPIPIPIPIPLLTGPRVLIWKQDPSVAEIGVRKAYIPSYVLTGPQDAQVKIKIPPDLDASVVKNAMGDFIETPGTEEFDYVHTFSIVRQTLTMYERALGGIKLPWQWNSSSNTDPLNVFPRAGVTANAFYSRTLKALKFFYFTPQGKPTVHTCQSLDIVSHETGHAVLDALKPSWLLANNPPQTGGLHESFGDLTAIFLALSQMDQVEAIRHSWRIWLKSLAWRWGAPTVCEMRIMISNSARWVPKCMQYPKCLPAGYMTSWPTYSPQSANGAERMMPECFTKPVNICAAWYCVRLYRHQTLAQLLRMLLIRCYKSAPGMGNR